MNRELRCTECGNAPPVVGGRQTLHGPRWNRALGDIIHADEKLCDGCAEKRPGYLAPADTLAAAHARLSASLSPCRVQDVVPA